MTDDALEAAGVVLTETDLKVAGLRYSLADLAAVDVVREAAPANGPILMTLAGALCLLSIAGAAGLAGGLLGVSLLLGAGIWWTRKRPSFQLRLQLGDDERVPFESQDEEVVRRLAADLETRLRARSA
jgi:hypothetical protein